MSGIHAYPISLDAAYGFPLPRREGARGWAPYTDATPSKSCSGV
jgi:hypothetical protein